MLFVKAQKSASAKNYNVFHQWKIKHILFPLRILQLILIGTIISPTPFYRFIKLERKAGTSYGSLLKKLFLNQHILRQKKLDWLHFGYATLAIGRENLAKAIQANMAVSFRGYDICLYPLDNNGCYIDVWGKIDKIHTVSNDLYHKALELGLHGEIPVQKVTPAINTDFFVSEKRNPFSGKVKILTVGRLHWKKGLSDTLHALSKLNEAGVDFQYTVVGEGDEYDKLISIAYELNIADKVNFMGKLSPQDVKFQYENHDLYLQYSISEGFCNAALEAQAMGLLCIVSDAEGLPENVLHEQTGWVVPKQQPELLAEHIKIVLALPKKEQNRIRNNATQRVQDEFNLNKQQKEFLEFYTQ
jgi:colanic acid/amylovoran biosynthesis glycosyltransferase